MPNIAAWWRWRDDHIALGMPPTSARIPWPFSPWGKARVPSKSVPRPIVSVPCAWASAKTSIRFDDFFGFAHGVGRRAEGFADGRDAVEVGEGGDEVCIALAHPLAGCSSR